MVRRILASGVNRVPYRLRPYISQVPGVACLQRALVSRILAGKPFIHTVNAGPAAGLRFEVTLPLDKAVWTGTYEQEFAQALAAGIRPGNVCFDVGGYRGYMSGIMALAGASRVIVFEPLPYNQEALRRLQNLNPLLPIDICTHAVGDIDGLMALKVMPDSSMAKLAVSPFQPEAAAVDEITVNVSRLDTLLRHGAVPAPDVIKIDVEGAESDVLAGAQRLLQTGHPRLFIELHSDALDRACARRLRDLGYAIRYIEPPIDSPTRTRHLIAEPA